MAPDRVTSDHHQNWMRNYAMQAFGSLPLKDVLWFPGSHDAGMDRVGPWGTTFGSRAVIQNQTHAISGQLKLGVRWFDIRPMRDRWGKWWCGHYGSAGPFLPWEGCTGESMDDVIRDVNDFLEGKAELVILRCTHIQSVHDGSACSEVEQVQLVEYLANGLKNIYVGPDSDCGARSLSHFIGNGQSSVILHYTDARPIDGACVMSDSVWNSTCVFRGSSIPLRNLRTDMPFTLESMCKEQSADEAIKATLAGLVDKVFGDWPWPIGGRPNTNDILWVARRLQDYMLPVICQHLSQVQTRGVCIFQIDDINDDRLLTICLAMSCVRYAQKFPEKARFGDLLCFYGGTATSYRPSLDALKDSVNSYRPYRVDNNSICGGDDPSPGFIKYCVVVHFENKSGELFCFIRGAREGENLDLGTDIRSIKLGDRNLTGQAFRQTYSKIFSAIMQGRPFAANLANMGVNGTEDANAVVVCYRSAGGPCDKIRTLAMNTTVHFGADIASILFDGQVCTAPDVYTPFFQRLDYGGDPIYVSLNTFNNWDPCPDKRKQACMNVRYGWSPMAIVQERAYEGDNWTVRKATTVNEKLIADINNNEAYV